MTSSPSTLHALVALPLLLGACGGQQQILDGTTSADATSSTTGGPLTGDGDPSTTAGDGDGDPSTGGDGDGEPSTGDGDGDGEPSTGDGDGDDGSSGGVKFDLSEVDTPDPIEEIPPWLVTMNKLVDAPDAEIHLFHVDIETGEAESVCVLTDADTQQPLTSRGPSLTFTRDDRLIASFTTYIAEITLPDCQVHYIGDIGFGQVFGIMPDEGNELYAISSASDALIHIDTGSGQGMEIGPLGQGWGTAGGTWIEATQDVIGLRASDDGIYDIDQNNGMAALLGNIDVDFYNVGIEFHPLTEQLYACSSDAHLYRIEDDYTTTDLGPMGLATSCTNLGAPWSTEVLLPQG